MSGLNEMTLGQKIEIAAEQIEESLDVQFSDDKRQIRAILTEFADSVANGVNKSTDQALHKYIVVCM